MLSFIGTLTEVFVTFPLEEDSFAPFVLCLLGPIAEEGRESILFAGSVMNGFVETGRLTIFSSRTIVIKVLLFCYEIFVRIEKQIT